MKGTWGLVALVVVLLALSAFFVAAEFALIAARRTVIEPRAVYRYVNGVNDFERFLRFDENISRNL